MAEAVNVCKTCGIKPVLSVVDVDFWNDLEWYEVRCHRCRRSITTPGRINAINSWNEWNPEYKDSDND